MMVDKVDSQQI